MEFQLFFFFLIGFYTSQKQNKTKIIPLKTINQSKRKKEIFFNA